MRVATVAFHGLARRATPRATPALVACRVRCFASDADLKKTPLYEFHLEHGGKMVPFAGWSMPIQYKDSIIEATLHCRSHASLFDVSHMCGVELTGPDAVSFIESIVVGDIAGLEDGGSTLSVIPNEAGGIIDDTVVTKVAEDRIYLVVNAGCREKDLAHIEAQLEKARSAGKGDLEMAIRDDRALLALQGPEAADVLQALVPADLSQLYFGQFAEVDVDGAPSYVTRTGYTGEDGFELSVPATKAVQIATRLAADERVRLCGLGPRDSLRLEAGLCLYGNDLDETTNPVRAGLTWTIGKRRRAEGYAFVGGEAIRAVVEAGAADRRVGLVSAGPPARQHSPILDAEGTPVGEVTSGAFSPTLKKNVAMGYVPKALAKAGTELQVEVRGKRYPAVVSKMPFVPAKYYKKP